jgi:hypothetical protein
MIGDEQDMAAQQAADDRARENGTYEEPEDLEAARELLVRAETANILLKREANRRADDIEAEGEQWPQVDLLEVFAEGIEPISPSMLEREDGQFLLYAGMSNCIFGDAGHGKSALAQWAVSKEIKAGRPVVVVDYELNVRIWIGRLLALGCTQEQILGSLVYLDVRAGKRPPAPPEGARLMVLDSLTAAIEAGGWEINDPRGIEAVYRHMINPYTDEKMAALVIDHVGHGDKKRPMNSVRKTGIVQGAMYLVEVIPGMEFGRNRVGQSQIILHKDNMGGIYASRGDTVARFMMASTEGGRKIGCKLLNPDDAATVMQTVSALGAAFGSAHERRKAKICNLLAEGTNDLVHG